jgi:hypothetical protein
VPHATQEPTKEELLRFELLGQAPPRTAFCVLQAPPDATVIEALVLLEEEPSVVGWKDVRIFQVQWGSAVYEPSLDSD